MVLAAERLTLSLAAGRYGSQRPARGMAACAGLHGAGKTSPRQQRAMPRAARN